MTEIPDTVQEVELKFQENGYSMGDYKWSRYSNDITAVNEYLRIKNLVESKMAAGEPVYVQIMDERRKGSVGRLNSITFSYHPPGSSNSYYRNHHALNVYGIEVVWDKRKNKCSPAIHEIEFLFDWEGPTQWNWNPGEAKEKEPRVIPYDSLGQEIEAGQFVCFVHRRYGETSMKFGTVTRMTPKGGVFVKSLKLRDGERGGEELKAHRACDLLIVNDTLMGRLMMARLSAN